MLQMSQFCYHVVLNLECKKQFGLHRHSLIHIALYRLRLNLLSFSMTEGPSVFHLLQGSRQILMAVPLLQGILIEEYDFASYL